MSNSSHKSRSQKKVSANVSNHGCAAEPIENLKGEALNRRLRQQMDWFQGKTHRDTKEQFGRAYAEILKEQGMGASIDKYRKAFERLYQRRERFIGDYGKKMQALLLEDLKGSKQIAKKEQLARWEEVREAREKLLGNPHLLMNTPVTTDSSCEITSENCDRDCSSGSIYDPEECESAFDIHEDAPGFNYLHGRAYRDNFGYQHCNHETRMKMTLNFEHPAPEGMFFIVNRLWTPLSGRGRICMSKGKMEDFPQCMMLQTDSIPGATWASIHLNVEIRQDGSHQFLRRRNEVLTFNTYRDYIANITIDDTFDHMFPVEMILFGTEREGGTIRGEVTLELYAHTYYNGQKTDLDFRDPGWLLMNFIDLEGARIDI